MPGIFRVSCTSCSFMVESVASSTYVALADGQEVICPHPLERHYAEDATGLEWYALVREGRLKYRYAFVCLDCCELVHRGPADLSDSARSPSHLIAITHQPSLEEASAYTCSSCSSSRLFPVSGQLRVPGRSRPAVISQGPKTSMSSLLNGSAFVRDVRPLIDSGRYRLNLWLLAWLTKRLWTSKPTHQVLGLPRPITPRVLAVLEPIDDDTPGELAEQIHADAHEVFWTCLRERGVPDGVYELVIRDVISGHRVRRPLDGCSWSLLEFDDFIDLGLQPHGAPEA